VTQLAVVVDRAINYPSLMQDLSPARRKVLIFAVVTAPLAGAAPLALGRLRDLVSFDAWALATIGTGTATLVWISALAVMAFRALGETDA
jgi:hypothetical protein